MGVTTGRAFTTHSLRGAQTHRSIPNATIRKQIDLTFFCFQSILFKNLSTTLQNNNKTKHLRLSHKND